MILRKTSRLLLSLILFITLQSELVQSLGQIIYAINCGGEAHTDTFGIHYERDPLNGKVGIASDYGKRLLIGRVHPDDNILYQTERYHTNTFGYDIPISGDGDYVLVLKFCEVYFNAVDQKVFDIVLNGDHTVISDLDIFEKVGRGFAHDEYVPFTISKGKLHLHTTADEEPSSGVRGGRIRLEFIKGYRDNPKVNAIFVMRGRLDQVPRLPPIEPDPVEDVLRGEQQQQHQQDTEEDLPGNHQDDQQQTQQRSTRRPNVPKLQPDPYLMEEDSSVMLPVFIAIGAFIPILFCLCKL